MPRPGEWTCLALLMGAVVATACGPKRAPGIELGNGGVGGTAGALPPLGGFVAGGSAGQAPGGAGGSNGGTSTVAGAPSGGSASGGMGTGGGSAGGLASGGQASGGAATGGAAAVCGNDAIELGEDCEGADLGGADCTTVGFDSGTLACAACAFDTDLCSGTEACTDGRDNDGDAAIDCADTDCTADCADGCANPPLLPDPALVEGATTGHANALDVGCSAGAGLSGGEVSYRFIAAETGVVEARVTSSDAELAVTLQRGCDTAIAELACALGAPAVAAVTAGDQLTVVVDGITAADAGSFSLEIASRAAACADGVLDPGEQCDDGAEVGGDGCAADCTVESSEQGQNDGVGQADPLATPFFGQITPAGDQDWIDVAVGAGGSLTAAVHGFLPDDCTSGDFDPYLELYDAAGTTLLAENDDADGLCASLAVTGLAAGTYALRVTAATQNTPVFPYVLDVTLP